MTYNEAAAYIEETPKFTRKNSLDHTRKCLAMLGDPEDHFRVIHVAGTNGKGSTCAFLDSILRQAGHTCGLFTSPHLVKINERFVVNGNVITDSCFLNAFREVMDMVNTLCSEGDAHPSYFELLFLMAMVIFRDAGVEFVVLETGLGGRLDATTAVKDPVLCLITSVSIDHVQYLGNTVREIAGEKAGILAEGVPCVFDGNSDEALRVLTEKARELEAPFRVVVSDDTEIVRYGKDGIVFRMRRGAFCGEEFRIPFIADYQVMNAALSLTAAEILNGILPGTVSPEAVHAGLETVFWPCRMEQVLQGVFVDGAHNEDGIRRFLETAERFSGNRPLTLLFSSVNDKNYEKMIAMIEERIRFDHIITTQVGGSRQVPAGLLAEQFRKYDAKDVAAEEDAAAAFRLALEKRKPDGILFCVGSLYLAGMIRSEIGRKAL